MSHNQDLVGVLDCGKPVGNHNNRSALGKLLKGGLDLHFGHVVQSAGGFVKNEYGRIFKEHTGDGDSLLLTARKVDTPFAHYGIIALFQGHYVIVNVGFFRRVDDFVVACVKVAVGDVVANGAREQKHVLCHDSDALSQGHSC